MSDSTQTAVVGAQPKARTKKEQRRLVRQVRRCVKAQEAGAFYYEQARAHLKEIKKSARSGEEIVFNEEGSIATFVDQLTEDGTIFKPVFVDRYKLKVKEAKKKP